MTTPSPESASTLDAALAAAVADSDKTETLQAAVQALAGHDLVLPQTAAPDNEAPAEGQITLPVIEQDQTSFVPAFTTAERLTENLPDVSGSIVIGAMELAAAWPSEDLWLAINPGDAETALALPGAAVRALAAVGGGPTSV
jgi:hypothetical protein